MRMAMRETQSASMPMAMGMVRGVAWLGTPKPTTSIPALIDNYLINQGNGIKRLLHR